MVCPGEDIVRMLLMWVLEAALGVWEKEYAHGLERGAWVPGDTAP